MFKKLFNGFKKKREVVKPEVEIVEEESIEEIVTEEEIVVPIPDVIEVDDRNIEDFDVDTKFRFEVYVGDNDNDVSLVNTHDFATLDEARAFGLTYAKENNKHVFFIHEEVETEDGYKALTRYY